MGKYTDANVPCRNCGQAVANHTWVEPDRKSGQSAADYEKARNEAQYERGANHDPNVKCAGYEPKV